LAFSLSTSGVTDFFDSVAMIFAPGK
jgi:hypothetical protein